LPEPTATILETPGNATGEGIAGEWAIVFLLLLIKTVVRDKTVLALSD
jgi:hypothetical protein